MLRRAATRSSIIISVMICAMLLLLLVNGSLYLQNRYYRQENRELIIRNDSIVSENLELKGVMSGSINNLKKTSFTQKTANKK